MKLDLHTHTTASDGSYTPNELVKTAISNNLKYLSITDHDNIEALEEISEIPDKLNFINGVEISAEFSKTLHILGYNFNKNNLKLNKKLNELQDYRKNRNHKMLANMKNRGFHITWEELKEEAKGEIVGRPHFASLMDKKGYVNSYQEAFDKYLKKGAPLYLNKKRLAPDTAIELILQSNGIPVMAHPYQTQLDEEDLESLIKKLRSYGLQGIEVFYSQHTDKQIEQYLKYAKKYELVITAGSDFHGTNKEYIELGMNVNREYIEPFLDRINK
ncbi:MAG: PHP domain-containing protein [Candidatus Cloacimonetes bacterium]|nr:PHP domain-containing protein [Candidatus Cloacimonadota bacterium]MBS3766948.1 PHP domain-containing protein [Candidatus Cloacimonadota bacterium]